MLVSVSGSLTALQSLLIFAGRQQRWARSQAGSSPLPGTLPKLARRPLLPQRMGSDRRKLGETKQANLCCPVRGREGLSQKKNRDNSMYFAPEAWQSLLA